MITQLNRGDSLTISVTIEKALLANDGMLERIRAAGIAAMAGEERRIWLELNAFKPEDQTAADGQLQNEVCEMLAAQPGLYGRDTWRGIVQQLMRIISRQNREIDGLVSAGQKVIERILTFRPRDEYGDDDRNVLWWRVPVEEPPFCGTPNDSDWPEGEDGLPEGYYTHWSYLPNPSLETSNADQSNPHP